MATPYVVKGATLECQFGSAPSELHVDDGDRAQINFLPMATVEDHNGENILPFGSCSSLLSGCVPNCIEWISGKSTVLNEGIPSLLETDITICVSGGGVVSITDNGQGDGMVSTPELREYRRILRMISKLSDRQTARTLHDALSILELRDRISILSIVLAADKDVQTLFFLFADKIRIGCYNLSCCDYGVPHFNPIDGTIHFDVAADRDGHNGQAMPFYYFFHEIGHMIDWAIAKLRDPDAPYHGFYTRDMEPNYDGSVLFNLLGDDVRNGLLYVAMTLGEEHGMLRYLEDRESAMDMAVDGIMSREKVVLMGESGREQNAYLFALEPSRQFQHFLQHKMTSVLDGNYSGFSVYIPSMAMRSIADIFEGMTNNTVSGSHPRVPLDGNIDPNSPHDADFWFISGATATHNQNSEFVAHYVAIAFMNNEEMTSAIRNVFPNASKMARDILTDALTEAAQ